MKVEAVNERTRRYIRDNFLYARPGFSLGDEVDLFRSGIIDSMGVMELIEFMQEEFRVSIDDEDITEENLGSIAAIGRYVSRRSSAEPAAPPPSAILRPVPPPPPGSAVSCIGEGDPPGIG